MPSANSLLEKTRQLQRALYRAAKCSTTRRFHALYDKIYRKDVLARAWQLVKANRGAAGLDGQSLQDIEDAGVDSFLQTLGEELRTEQYRPTSLKRVYIPKASGGVRPLSIPAIRDRVVQAAAKLVLEPIFEADFLPCSFGFRPRRSAGDAVEAIRVTLNDHHHVVVDADIKDYFGSIDHRKLMVLLEKRISDRRILTLIRSFLKAGILEDGEIRSPTSGAPQGGVLSPLLSNVYLHYLDSVWTLRCSEVGRLARYADDLVVICKTSRLAREARRRLDWVMHRLGLSLHPDKTRMANLWMGQDSFDFLGFHIQRVRMWRKPQWMYANLSPSKRAMKSIRAKVRECVDKRNGQKTLYDIVEKLNPVLRGWGNYFRYGNSSHHFAVIDNYVKECLALFLSRKHQRKGRSWKRWKPILSSLHGLYRLYGTVAY